MKELLLKFLCFRELSVGASTAHVFKSSLVPEQSGFEKKKQVQWGTIKVGGTKDNYTITFDDDIEVAPNPA